MKILVIQLARLGDIFMTWPILKALSEKHPAAEIHFLTREKFKEAAYGLDFVKHHILNTSSILGPVIDLKMDINESLGALDKNLDTFKNLQFDQIINLSFSPVSSYLTWYISQCYGTENVVVRGYTRHSDGFLNLPDDSSAFFYSQVGIQRDNRIHLTDLFAEVADAVLKEEHFDFKKSLAVKQQIAIHVAASQREKTLTADQWLTLTQELLKQTAFDIVLVGSSSESDIALNIISKIAAKADLPLVRVKNLVGAIDLSQLKDVIEESLLLIGADSSPMHIASLVNTKCLNVSSDSVNFWETGPRALGSFIYKTSSFADIDIQKLTQLVLALTGNEILDESGFLAVGGVPYYKSATKVTIAESKDEKNIRWESIRAIYLSAQFPKVEDSLMGEAFIRLLECNEVILDQLKGITSKEQAKNLSDVLNQGDHILSTIAKLVPDVKPYLNWLEAEKIRIPPLQFEQVLEKTTQAHQTFENLILLQLGVSDEHAQINP